MSKVPPPLLGSPPRAVSALLGATARVYPKALQPRSATSLQQAVQQAPTLSRLAAAASKSQACLDALNSLLPAALRKGIKAGPLEDDQWCLLAANSAVAAKLRQLSPTLLEQLRTQGWEITAIRIKVQVL